ncbi:MAG TPA: hypothetical protein VJ938_06665 [Acidimicrobiia bacterium]|nr:hypothetical protein [Acidimicrobiia bacterium]
MTDELARRVQAALEPLPDETGGIAVVLATAAEPPALAVLSSGDVLIREDVVRVGIHASSSTVHRFGGSFSLLVPLGEVAARVEALDGECRVEGDLALIEGRVSAVRATAEPPWLLELGFRPAEAGHPASPSHLSYWRAVRMWLAGELPKPPSLPG